MANQYHVYVGTDYDPVTKEHTGGTLDATFTTEREAFYRVKKLEWEFKKGVTMIVEGDERFMIVQVNDPDLPYHIVDKRTQGYCYGVCRTREEAIQAKAWDEKYHYEHWYEEYYKQYKAA